MPNLDITAGQFRTSLQNIQPRFVKIELLNYQYQTVDFLEGVCTAGSFTIDAQSDIRRTGSLVLVVQDSSFEVKSGGKIWLDKYVKVWVGTRNVLTTEIEWTNCGIYIVDAPNYQYDASTNTLTLTLLDLMAKLTGVRNGFLKGIPTKFVAGENIRKAIIDTLALGGFTKYIVEEAPAPGVIPNDLEFDQGSTIYDLLAGLKNIYPGYEMFFDVEGTFYYKPIPSGENDPVLVDDSLWESIVISEQVNIDFQNVKNVIEVYGKTHDPKHYSEVNTVSGNNIQLNIADVTQYTEDLIYGFQLTDNPGYQNMTLNINDLDAYPLTLDDGITPAIIPAEQGSVYYCVQYKGTYWNWLGHLQSYGYAEDTNPESPFNINSTVGIIRQPLFGSDYNNIFSDDLAQQRAKYELWVHTNLKNTIQLNCVMVPWLDVNILTDYTVQRNRTKERYIIKNISYGLAPTDTMSVTLMKFYPEPN